MSEVTPIRPGVTPIPADILAALPVPDLDTAFVALSQAYGILDSLTYSCDGLDIPNTCDGTLVQCLYASMSEITRARVALREGQAARL